MSEVKGRRWSGAAAGTQVRRWRTIWPSSRRFEEATRRVQQTTLSRGDAELAVLHIGDLDGQERRPANSSGRPAVAHALTGKEDACVPVPLKLRAVSTPLPPPPPSRLCFCCSTEGAHPPPPAHPQALPGFCLPPSAQLPPPLIRRWLGGQVEGSSHRRGPPASVRHCCCWNGCCLPVPFARAGQVEAGGAG